MIWAILTVFIWGVAKLEGGGQLSVDWILQPVRAIVFPLVLWAVYRHEVGEETYGRERVRERDSGLGVVLRLGMGEEVLLAGRGGSAVH
jgi:hypothetical protein